MGRKIDDLVIRQIGLLDGFLGELVRQHDLAFGLAERCGDGFQLGRGVRQRRHVGNRDDLRTARLRETPAFEDDLRIALRHEIPETDHFLRRPGRLNGGAQIDERLHRGGEGDRLPARQPGHLGVVVGENHLPRLDHQDAEGKTDQGSAGDRDQVFRVRQPFTHRSEQPNEQIMRLGDVERGADDRVERRPQLSNELSRLPLAEVDQIGFDAVAIDEESERSFRADENLPKGLVGAERILDLIECYRGVDELIVAWRRGLHLSLQIRDLIAGRVRLYFQRFQLGRENRRIGPCARKDLLEGVAPASGVLEVADQRANLFLTGRQSRRGKRHRLRRCAFTDKLADREHLGEKPPTIIGFALGLGEGQPEVR